MARAKHRDKLYHREYLSFVAKCRKAEAHDELLKQHKDHKRKNANG